MLLYHRVALASYVTPMFLHSCSNMVLFYLRTMYGMTLTASATPADSATPIEKSIQEICLEHEDCITPSLHTQSHTGGFSITSLECWTGEKSSLHSAAAAGQHYPTLRVSPFKF